MGRACVVRSVVGHSPGHGLGRLLQPSGTLGPCHRGEENRVRAARLGRRRRRARGRSGCRPGPGECRDTKGRPACRRPRGAGRSREHGLGGSAARRESLGGLPRSRLPPLVDGRLGPRSFVDRTSRRLLRAAGASRGTVGRRGGSGVRCRGSRFGPYRVRVDSLVRARRRDVGRGRLAVLRRGHRTRRSLQTLLRCGVVGPLRRDRAIRGRVITANLVQVRVDDVLLSAFGHRHGSLRTAAGPSPAARDSTGCDPPCSRPVGR